MKTKLSLILATLLIAAAAVATEAPMLDVHLITKTTARQIRSASGPIEIRFDIPITNRSDAPVTVTRVEVRTDDTAGFTLEDGSKKVHVTIAPQDAASIVLRARSIAPADVARTEPLMVFVRLTFTGPGGTFVKERGEFIQ